MLARRSPGISRRPHHSMSEGVVNRIAGILGRRAGLAVGLVAGLGVSVAAPAALAQSVFDQGYFVSATRDDPDIGPVSIARDDRRNLRTPFFREGFLINGAASVTRSDPLPDGSELYFGSAISQGQAMAGDRFAKASTFSVLDSTTGKTDASALAIWSTSATPSISTLADVSVLLDRRLYFGDFRSNTDRGNQILDYANENLPAFDFAIPLSLSASVSLDVRIRELRTDGAVGTFWSAFLQEEVNRNFLYIKDANGLPVVIGGTGDQAFTRLSYLTNVSGQTVETRSTANNVLNFDQNSYPPRYGTTTRSIFGLTDVFLNSNQSYEISLSLTCFSEISALSGLAEPTTYSAGCEAGNSAYWLGLNNFRDENRNRIAPVEFLSSDGVNLALASPLAPPGGGPGPIPEPTTWALMISGFGLAGAALRRRRAGRVAA